MKFGFLFTAFRLVTCLVFLRVPPVVHSLPVDHILIDSSGFANIAFRSREGDLFLIRFNDFYYNFRTSQYDNFTVDTIHSELERGQAEFPPAYSEPRVFELQQEKRLFLAYVSQDLRITLFEKSNETKKWLFTESERIRVLGSIAGFGDAEGIVHVLHRQSGRAMQELLFDPQTYEWLATTTIPFPNQVTTDFHLCQRGLEHFVVIQTSGKLYLSTQLKDSGWSVFRLIPTSVSLRGSPYCFEGQMGDLVIVVTDDSGRVLVLKEKAKQEAQVVSSFGQEVLQEVTADSGLSAGDAMGYRGRNGSESIVYRGLNAQVYLATFHANKTWGKTIDLRSLGCRCYNRPTNDPFGYVTGAGHHQVIYRYGAYLKMFWSGRETEDKAWYEELNKNSLDGWGNLFSSGSFDVRNFAAVPPAAIETKSSCPLESYNASDRCDCGCFQEIGGDPDCLNPAVTSLVCVKEGGSKFSGTHHRCDEALNQCTAVKAPVNCTDLNRYPANSSDTCGRCFLHYKGKPGPGTGMCTYAAVVGFRPVPTTKNPLIVVQGDRIPAAAFGDLDNDGDQDFVLGSGRSSVEWYENVGNSTHPKFKNRGSKHFEVHGEGVNPLEHNPYFMGYDPFPSLVDLNGDGLLDLVMATRRARDLNVYFNRGNDTRPVFYRGGNIFPKVVATNMRATFYDWDNDGDYDAVISSRYDGLIALENVGNRTHPRFAAYPDQRCPLRNVITSTRLAAQLHDVDQDGLVDLLVSQKIPGDMRRVFLWRNIGSVTEPKFQAADLSNAPLYGLEMIANSADAFTFVNLYGKGFNIVVSNGQGGLTLLTSQPEIPQKIALLLGPANPFNAVTTPFSRSSPSLVDIDGDGDLDIFFGDEKAVVSFYRNVGHPGKPDFVRVDGPENPLHGVLPGGLEEMALSFVDIDGDGDLDCYVNAKQERLVKVFGNEFPLFKNEGNKTHPYFRQARRDENPLADIIRTTRVNSRCRSYFVDLNGDGLKDMIFGGAYNGQSVALGGEGVRYFVNIGSGFEEQFGEKNPFSQFSDIGRFAGFACFDWDLDGDVDCLVISWSERSFFLLNVGNSTFPIFVLSENDPLKGFKGAISAENPAFGDIDADGQVDMIAGSNSGNVIYFRNIGLDCYSSCLGRGFCGEIPMSEVPDDSPILAAVASFQGFQTHGEAVGKCWCTSQFQGLSCEMCSEEYYGTECSLSCPKFSRNTAKVVFPEVSTIEHCQCLPTFHKILRSEGSGFDCVCPPGHEFIQELGVCQQCGAGRFHPDYDLAPCTSCADLFGPRSTTVTSTGTSSGACVCETTFGMYNGQCVCARDHYGDKNASFCTKCPEILPFTLSPGTQRRDECLAGPGSFRLNKGQVLSCNSPEFRGKVECLEKGISLSSLPLRPGFWRLAETSTQILPCSPLARCVPVQNKSLPSDEWWSDVYCTPGHTGVLCEGCKHGFSRSLDGCVSCTQEKLKNDEAIGGLWIFLACVVVLLPACRVLYVAKRKKTRSNKRMRRNQSSVSTQKIRKAVGGCTWAYNAWKVRVTLLIGFFQVYVQFVTITGLIDGGSAGITFLQTFAQFDLSALYMAFDAPCLLPVHYVFQLLVYTLLPLISIMLMLSILFYKRSVEVFGSTIYLTLLILFFVYPGVSSLVFQSFVWNDYYRSAQDSSPLQALAVDLTILAGSSEATLTTIYGAVMVLVYPVGVVVLFYAAIRFYTTHSSSSSEFYAHLAKSVAFLVESYTVPWYECYELLRKLILTSGNLLVYTASSDGGVLFYLVLATFFLYANRVIGGYRSVTDFRFAEASHILLWSLGILPLASRIDAPTAANLAIAIPVIEVVLFAGSGYLPEICTASRGVTSEATSDTNTADQVSSGATASEVHRSNVQRVEKANRASKGERHEGRGGGFSSRLGRSSDGEPIEEASCRQPELYQPAWDDDVSKNEDVEDRVGLH